MIYDNNIYYLNIYYLNKISTQVLTTLNTELDSLATGDIGGVVQLLAAATTKQQGSQQSYILPNLMFDCHIMTYRRITT